jgi:hypothetical protein
MARRGRRAGGPVPGRFQTYRLLAPLASHHRRATCAEVDCPDWHRAGCGQAGCQYWETGWRTTVPAGSVLERDVRRSGRRFLETPEAAGTVSFLFFPHQQCFAAPHWAPGAGPCQVEHFVPLDRPGIYRVDSGASVTRFGERADLWAEHWAEHADRVQRHLERVV